jgi:hypothetical protein
MGWERVWSHRGATITGSFSTRSRMISNEALPEPTMMPLRRVVRWKRALCQHVLYRLAGGEMLRAGGLVDDAAQVDHLLHGGGLHGTVEVARRLQLHVGKIARPGRPWSVPGSMPRLCRQRDVAKRFRLQQIQFYHLRLAV